MFEFSKTLGLGKFKKPWKIVQDEKSSEFPVGPVGKIAKKQSE